MAHDAAGNANAASTSTDNTVTYDVTSPTVTINQAAGKPIRPTCSPINFTVVFSEPVTDFATGDVTLSGTAGATTAIVTGSGTTYNVAVSGMTGSGTVIANVSAGVATDSAGNSNAAATSTDNTVTFDNVSPTVTVNSLTTNDTTPVISGTVSDGTLSVIVNGVTYHAGDGNLVVSGSTWALTIPAGNALIVGTYEVAASATDSVGNTGADGTTNELVITLTADTFEPNDSFAAASLLAPPGDHTYGSLSIHASLNDDYYRVTASAAGTLSFDLAFQHSQGDIDMDVFNASQTLLGRSDSVANSEHFSVTAVAGEYFFVRVFGYKGATNPNYTLSVDQPGGSVPNGDLFENNDSFAAASNLAAADQTYSNLSIDAAGDDDYYSLVPVASGTMTVSLAFLHSQGDLDLRVFNASQTQLGKSDSVANSEQVSVQVTAGQTYYIRAYGFNGAINPNYSMTIDVPGPTTAPLVTINQAATQADPTGISPINFTVVFSEPVLGFATGDVTLSGTAGATTAIVSGSGTTYNVAVSGMTGSGTVIANVLAGVATNSAGSPMRQRPALTAQ